MASISEKLYFSIERIKEMRKQLILEEKVHKLRKNLEKQDAWAERKAKHDFMDNVTIKELWYGESKRERLDLIYPNKRGNEKLPVFFYIHGGGWIAGSKEARRNYCSKFSDSGYFVVSIEYELAPEARFPVAIGQCICAVDFMLDHSEEHQLDTDRMALGGESAGVYYAAFVSAIAKDKSILEKLGLQVMRHIEFDVKVNIFNCGAVDFKLMADYSFPGVDYMLEAYTGYTLEEVNQENIRKSLTL